MDCPWKRPKNVRKSNEFCPMDCPWIVCGRINSDYLQYIQAEISGAVPSYYIAPGILDRPMDCPWTHPWTVQRNHNHNQNIIL